MAHLTQAVDVREQGGRPAGNGFDYRIRALEDGLRELRADLRAARIDVLSDRVARLADDLREFKKQQAERDKDKEDEMTNFRRAILGVGGTLVVGLVILILTLATGRA